MISLKLSSEANNWDLSLDAGGNIATVSGSEAIAQDVACAIKTFLGEAYFDTTLGIPYFPQVLGEGYSPALLQALMAAQALSVPGVAPNPPPKVTITKFADRMVTGLVEFTDATGVALNVQF